MVATVTESLDLSINGIALKKVNCSKSLGVELDEFLSWDSHITSVCKKVSSGTGVIKKDQDFYSFAQFNCSIGIVVLFGMALVRAWPQKLQKLQNRAARIITGSDYMAPTKDMLEKLGWSNLKGEKK